MPTRDIDNRLSIKKRIPNLSKRRRSTSRDTKNRPVSVNKENLLDASLDYRFTMDFEGIINYANPDFCNLLGYEAYEIVNESSDMLIHQDVPDVFFEWYLEHLLSKEPTEIATKLITKDGHAVWMMLNVLKKIDNNKKTLSYNIIGEKISDASIKNIAHLFKILNKIENKTGGIEASQSYLIALLEDLNLTYDEYINSITVVKTDIGTSHISKIQKKNSKVSYNPDMDIFRDY